MWEQCPRRVTCTPRPIGEPLPPLLTGSALHNNVYVFTQLCTVNSHMLDLDSWTDLERQVDPAELCSVLRPPPSLNCASSSCARRSARLPSPAPGGLGREPSSEDSHLRYAKRATCPHARARGADQVALDKEEQPRGTEHGARSTERRHGAELTVRRLRGHQPNPPPSPTRYRRRYGNCSWAAWMRYDRWW